VIFISHCILALFMQASSYFVDYSLLIIVTGVNQYHGLTASIKLGGCYNTMTG